MPNYQAPPLATAREWARETGRPIWEAYKMIRTNTMPHIVLGEQSKRILMIPYRKMIAGEPIDPRLFEGKPLTTKEAAT